MKKVLAWCSIHHFLKVYGRRRVGFSNRESLSKCHDNQRRHTQKRVLQILCVSTSTPQYLDKLLLSWVITTNAAHFWSTPFCRTGAAILLYFWWLFLRPFNSVNDLILRLFICPRHSQGWWQVRARLTQLCGDLHHACLSLGKAAPALRQVSQKLRHWRKSLHTCDSCP